MIKDNFYKNRKVIVTGDTGFKGAWLVSMLSYLGADSVGYALPAVDGCLYQQILGSELIEHIDGDLLAYDELEKVFLEAKPEIVFHLAAYGFMKECYDDPVQAYRTNVLGTVNLLETIRRCESVKCVVIVSTDKVYLNKGDGALYSENDILGGNSPYSCSKTCMEFVVKDYADTYFCKQSRKIGIGVVRASNVLAGGDHIASRLIPSILTALDKNEKVEIRNPLQTRPWQSVLDALDGYLTVAKYLYEQDNCFFGVWNIGPKPEGIKSVQWIFDKMKSHFDSLENEKGDGLGVNESATLGLNIVKAYEELDWEPKLSVDRTVEMVVDFFKKQKAGINSRLICMNQIEEYYSLKDSR